MHARPVDLLFDEYAEALERGARPRAAEFLHRAGADADELAAMIDRLLIASPRREPTPEDAALVAALVRSEPPLLELRVRLGLKREAVVESLLRALGLRESLRERLKGAYHELETGQLDPAGVDASVWRALGEILKANARDLAGWRPPPVAASPAYRASAGTSLETPLAIGKDQEAAVDEVDRLFRAVS